jgi:two-component system sensor histidine kinase KdpD
MFQKPGTGYLLAVLGVAAVTALLEPIHHRISVTTVSLTLLMVVLFIATFWGSRPAFVASIFGALTFNYFFLPPFGTLSVKDSENWIAFGAFLVTALTAGQLSSRAKRRAEESERLYLELQNAFERVSHAEALKRSEKLKSVLLDAITHDLRTPLTSIKASVTMLIEELEQDSIDLTLEREGRSDLLEVINEETDRLNDFVQSMVELARLEAGEFQLRKTQTVAEEIISNALQRAERQLAKHKVETEIENDLPLLSLDSKAIAEAVYNLLDNAAKYSPESSKIRVGARRINSKIQFSIEDEGKAVPEKDREKIFQKFYRADKSGKGFGMGLAIVRGIIEAHEGRVWVEDGNSGSKFVFDLPLGTNE